MRQPSKQPEDVSDCLEERGLLDLAHAICDRHHVTIDELLGRSRMSHIIAARFQLWFYLYMQKRMSTKGIGKIFGVDHSSVLHGIKKHGGRVCEDLESSGDE
jgi:chromosomal replication initiation ATPase DnaA